MSINIKKCFTSRFDRGFIVELDFSQLEVIGAALISGDPVMKQDILDGVDSHSQSASWLNPQHSYEEILREYKAGDPYFTKLRKNAKAPRFELQYGAQAPSIARNNNLTREVAQGFIDRYYARYSVLQEFQDSVMEEIVKSRKPTSQQTKWNKYPVGRGEYVSVTGRRYVFFEEEAPAFLQRKGTLTQFSSTQPKNYPMQGFATGDVVPEVLGRVHEFLGTKDKMVREHVLPINTVHDSVIFDVHEDFMYIVEDIRQVMERAPEWMYDRFGLTLDLPFKVDVEYGINWQDLKEYKHEHFVPF